MDQYYPFKTKTEYEQWAYKEAVKDRDLFIAGRESVLSKFESADYYRAKPHKALDDLLRVIDTYQIAE